MLVLRFLNLELRYLVQLENALYVSVNAFLLHHVRAGFHPVSSPPSRYIFRYDVISFVRNGQKQFFWEHRREWWAISFSNWEKAFTPKRRAMQVSDFWAGRTRVLPHLLKVVHLRILGDPNNYRDLNFWENIFINYRIPQVLHLELLTEINLHEKLHNHIWYHQI